MINRFTVNDIEFGFIPSLDEMTFGEYVDIDTYIKDWKQMHKAMAVLYRPIEAKYDDRYNIVAYDGEETDIMKDMPLSVCFSSIVFLQFRNRVVANYDGLYGADESDTKTAIGGFGAKMGWYQSIFALAKGDVRRFENITRLNMHQCLMALEFIKEKNDLEMKQIKNRR